MTFRFPNPRLARLASIRPDTTREILDRVIAKRFLDDKAATTLTERHRYSDACRVLVDLARPTSPRYLLPALLERCNLAVVPFRVALAFGVVKEEHDKPLVTIEMLRDLARGSEDACAALAALGKPNLAWCNMRPRERAAILLGIIVRAHRDGAVPP